MAERSSGAAAARTLDPHHAVREKLREIEQLYIDARPQAPSNAVIAAAVGELQAMVRALPPEKEGT